MGKLGKFSPSDFQIKCMDGLISLVRKKGGEVTDTETKGQDEGYVVVNFTLPDSSFATAWIYVDECMLTAKNNCYHFERPDFENEEKLIDLFFELVSSLCHEGQLPAKGENWVGFFRGRKL